MPLTNDDLLAIKAELTNDPLNLGLTILPEDDVANADALNLVRETIQVDRETVPASDISKAIDRDEFNALSAADRQWLGMITASGSVNPQAGGEVREGLLQMFAANSETRANLMALLTEASSRVHQFYKSGVISDGGNLTPSDIANARNAV